ncbi:response regulator [bacterium]|nr:response regulator [bacterium]
MKNVDILIIDDTPANLDLLFATLKAQGWKVRLLPSGELGVKAAIQQIPDLVLLDINMPTMNGYEVCKLFKEDSLLKDIPIIFISAFDNTDDKVKAFHLGGVDYITKPFHQEEVLARVKTHLQIARLQNEVQAKNEELRLSFEKEKQLGEFRYDLMNCIVHDIKSPLSGASLALKYLKNEKEFDPDELEMMDGVISSVEKVTELSIEMLNIGKLEAFNMPVSQTNSSIVDIVKESYQALCIDTQTFKYNLTVTGDEYKVFLDEKLIQRVLENFISNAVKFSKMNPTIEIKVFFQESKVRIEVIDQGPGLPKGSEDELFEKYVQKSLQNYVMKGSVGLGLWFCKLVIDAHNGEIGAYSLKGKYGSCFYFELAK